MTKTIWILAIAVAFVAGTIATGTMAFAGVNDEFEVDLSGSEEVPSVVTDTTGEAEFEFEDGTLEFELEVEDAVVVVAAHIHCGAVGVNGPVGVTLFAGPPFSGDGTLAEGTITAPNAVNACGWADLSDVLAAMNTPDTYVNVHTAVNPGGEIRGQIDPGDDDDDDGDDDGDDDDDD